MFHKWNLSQLNLVSWHKHCLIHWCFLLNFEDWRSLQHILYFLDEWLKILLTKNNTITISPGSAYQNTQHSTGGSNQQNLQNAENRTKHNLYTRSHLTKQSYILTFNTSQTTIAHPIGNLPSTAQKYFPESSEIFL